MSSDKYDVLLICLNDKNQFQFQKFVKVKNLWGHVDDTSSAPNNENQSNEYVEWEVKDAQIMAWIIGSVDPHIVLNLRPFNTADKIWVYLKKIYNHNNTARGF